jgi:hypothetical protein
MRSRQRDPGWTAVHIVYTTPAARLRLLTEDLGDGALFGDGRGFFADVPIETRGGLRSALEVALPGGALAEDLRARLRAAPAGLVAFVVPAAVPLVLEPARFPAGRVPQVYRRAMAVSSARAVEVLRALKGADVARLLPGVVRAEVAYTYGALIPSASQRRAAMLEHAAWLEGLADRTGQPAADVPGVGAATAVAPPASVHTYEHLRRPLVEQAARLAARAGRRGDATYADPSIVRTVLVGRLAHTQVVRLCGLEFQGMLRWEASLLRNLRSETTFA